MTRLPTPGGDAGNWGTILNEYLSTVHNTDGSLKSGVVAGSHLADGSITTDKLADASITTTKLASSVQTTLSSVVTTSNVGVAGGIAGLDSSGKVPASQLPEASGGATPEASATVSGTIRLSGDLGGTASSPTVTKLSGVSLSGTPSAGQALVATSSTVASWQTVSGGATNPNAGTVWNTASDPATGATASSVKDGDMWTDGTTEPTKVLVKARVSGQWVTTAELTKPVVTTTTAPLPTTDPTVTDTSVTLSWTAPSQVVGTLDGYNVYEGSSTTPLNSALIPATTTSFTTTTPLTPGTNYSFVIKAVSTPPSGSQTESAGLTIQATTTGTVVNPLPAPTGVTATAGNATASVAFNLVTGATSYTVTATPGGINKIGATSPITVDGLANGTSYTFTVSATDGTRTSAESAVSGAVVPSGTGGGTAGFQINNGAVYGPDGNVFVPIGANVGSRAGTNYVRGTEQHNIVGHVNDVKAWGWNAIRLVVTQTSEDTWSLAYHNRAAGYVEILAIIDQVVNEYTSQNIVVMIDNHDLFDLNINTDVPSQFKAIGLTNPLIGEIDEFWTDIATKYKNNPYVWFNLDNEPIWNNNQAWIDLHKHHLDLVRAIAPDNIVVIDAMVAGGDLGPVGGLEGVKYSYAPDMMGVVVGSHTNVMLSMHNYGGWDKYTTDAALTQYIDNVHNAGYALLIGEMGYDCDASLKRSDAGGYDRNRNGARACMSVCKGKNVGMFWWHGTMKTYMSLKQTYSDPWDARPFYADGNDQFLSEAGQLYWALTH